MDINQFHFAAPLWLLMILVLPLTWLAFFFFYRSGSSSHRLDKLIDSHLLPYLLIHPIDKKGSRWKSLLLWSVVWSCLTLALAGPRWTFREIETFSKDQSLVILLDLSESMNATDIKPSRLVRAKQKIEDLLRASNGVKIGLIAFAADPHMITPLTEDKDTIRYLLPSLQTDLVYVQGSRLSPAFDMASTLLNNEPGHNKSLLVVSDGGFEDASAMTTAQKLVEKGIVIHTMGVGTLEGAPLKDREGKIIKKNGTPLLSRLEKETLNEISRIGKGYYLEAHYSNQDEDIIFSELEQRAEAAMETGKKSRLWDERFYFLIFPVIPIILWWFRKGGIFALTILLLTSPLEATDYFKNSEQRGEEAMNHGDYETAIHTFQDCYRKGVAHYKAGNFEEAEKMFRESSREEVASSAAYNLGNALVQQQKLKEAVEAYEDVLKKWPDHTKAKDNLELVKKMLEQQKQDDQEKDKDEGEESQEDQEDKNGDQENDDNDNSKEEEEQQPEASTEEQQEARTAKSQEEQDADAWLNQLSNDPKEFMQNKFFIESKRNGTKEGLDPW